VLYHVLPTGLVYSQGGRQLIDQQEETHDKWIVAVTRSRQESWAAENVRAHGFEAYYPCFREEYIDRQHHIGVRTRSLFPRYLFVRTDGRWSFLTDTFGVTGVVMKGEVPATMPDQEIDHLRQREDAVGLIEVPKEPEAPRFTKGQRVRVTYGSMCGLTGICECIDAGKARVRVLLDMLGRKTSVLLPRDSLAAAI